MSDNEQPPLDIFDDDDDFASFYDPTPPQLPTPTVEQQLRTVEAFQRDILERLTRLERNILGARSHCTVTSTQSREPMTDLNGRSFDVQATKVSSVDKKKLTQVLTNPKLTAPIQVGMELAKIHFSEHELASSTLTGRRVNGQVRQSLDPAKLCLIDNLVQQKCGLAEAEFSAVRSGIRDSLANQCKYLRLKLGARNMSII